MSRVAIIGSCITRDLWPILGIDASELLYISRTSLGSLFSKRWDAVEVAEDPPEGLNRQPHSAVVADLKKTALSALIGHQPSHIIFDFIDERFDLLGHEGAIATASWELEVSGYLAQPALATANSIPRLSNACDLIWQSGLAEMANFLAATPLREAKIILHESQWAGAYRDIEGRDVEFDDLWEQMPGKRVSRQAHNQLLARYQTRFLQQLPSTKVVAAPSKRIADASHRWGLSPFHYVDGYYREIWNQLTDLALD